jgi:hypothetical protein
MSDKVWLLWFEQEREVGEDTELLIGVYRTEKKRKGSNLSAQRSAGI